MLDKLRKLAFELEGATDWTWYNLIPRVVGYAFASVGWAVYWPLLNFLEG